MYSKNQYALRTEIAKGHTRYLVSFTDGEGNNHETVVSRPVYLEFLRFVVIERSLRHWDERHREYSELTEEMMQKRALSPQKSLEDIVFGNIQREQLRSAIHQLSESQQRRFVFYYDFGLTYDQIADIEGCSFQAVGQSLKVAKRSIRKYFSTLH